VSGGLIVALHYYDTHRGGLQISCDTQLIKAKSQDTWYYNSYLSGQNGKNKWKNSMRQGVTLGLVTVAIRQVHCWYTTG
jgi:hypothetical protein